MKKLLSLVLAAAMIMSMGVMAFAYYTLGDVVTADGSRIDEDLTNENIAPGSRVYLVICEYDSNNELKKAKLVGDSSEDRDWISNDSSLNIVKLKEDSTRYYCVEIRVKNVSLSAYDEDGYTYNGTLTLDFEDDSDPLNGEHYLSIDIAYELADYSDELGEQLKLFVLEKEDELHITDEDGYVTLEGEVVGDTKVLAGLNTDVIDKIEDKYGEDANLEYFNFTGTFKRVKKGVLTIEPDDSDYKYLYEYKDGGLTNLSKYWDSDDDCFYIEFGGSSFELGTYVISDEKLSVSSSSGSVSSSTSTGSSSSSNNNIHNNPMTGAVA